MLPLAGMGLNVASLYKIRQKDAEMYASCHVLRKHLWPLYMPDHDAPTMVVSNQVQTSRVCG